MNERKHVGLVTSSLDIGGADILVANLAHGLIERGWEVNITSLTTTSLGASRLRGLQVEALRLQGPYGLPRAVRQVRRATAGADLVHSHMYHANIVSRLAVSDRPVINTVHSVNEGSSARDLVYRTTNWRADEIVAVGDEVARVRGPAAFPNRRMRVVPNAVDVRVPREVEPSVRCLVSVGRLVEAKGFDLLVAAMPALLRMHGALRCVIVGDGPDRRTLEAQIRSLGLSEVVRVTGFVEDVRPFLEAATVYVQPSRWEGLPVALLEAMAVALPVVVTSVGSMPETVEPGGGTVVCPESIDELTGALSELLSSDEQTRRSIGLKMHEIVTAHHSFDAHMDRWERLYREMLGSAPTADPY